MNRPLRRSLPVPVLLLVAACAGDGGGGAEAPAHRPPIVPNADVAPPPVCGPLATGGPFWLQETETVVVTFACANGRAPGEVGLTVRELPEGATWDDGAATVTWTPRLDQAAVYELVAEVGDPVESVAAEIQVADAWHHPDNVPVVDPLRYPREYGLPVLFLSPVPKTKEYVPVTVVHGGHVYTAEGKLRGASSMDYPKKHFTLSFTREDKFQEPSRGFRNKRKINLHSGFDDNSHLRNRLSFDTWNRMDPEHVRMQSYSAVLYLDGRYWGLYTVIDHIDGFLMEDHGYDQDGDLFKAVTPEANWRLTFQGASKSSPHAGYEKKEGFPVEGEAGAWNDLDAAVTFVATADAATFRAEIGSWLDVRDYMDWWVLSVLLFASDSVDKNSYHFHDEGPFRFIPWDYNASFGQNWRTMRYDADVRDYFTDDNGLFERFLADPVLRQALFEREALVLTERCTVDAMLARIDEIAAEIAPSAKRDERKWGAAYRAFPRWAERTDFTTWEEEVRFVRDWTEARWEIEKERVGAAAY